MRWSCPSVAVSQTWKHLTTTKLRWEKDNSGEGGGGGGRRGGRRGGGKGEGRREGGEREKEEEEEEFLRHTNQSISTTTTLFSLLLLSQQSKRFVKIRVHGFSSYVNNSSPRLIRIPFVAENWFHWLQMAAMRWYLARFNLFGLVECQCSIIQQVYRWQRWYGHLFITRTVLTSRFGWPSGSDLDLSFYPHWTKENQKIIIIIIQRERSGLTEITFQSTCWLISIRTRMRMDWWNESDGKWTCRKRET